jgi:hypothetical protein
MHDLRCVDTGFAKPDAGSCVTQGAKANRVIAEFVSVWLLIRATGSAVKAIVSKQHHGKLGIGHQAMQKLRGAAWQVIEDRDLAGCPDLIERLAVSGNDDCDVDASLVQCQSQSSNDIAKAAGFGKRNRFGGDKQDAWNQDTAPWRERVIEFGPLPALRVNLVTPPKPPEVSENLTAKTACPTPGCHDIPDGTANLFSLLLPPLPNQSTQREPAHAGFNYQLISWKATGVPESRRPIFQQPKDDTPFGASLL